MLIHYSPVDSGISIGASSRGRVGERFNAFNQRAISYFGRGYLLIGKVNDLAGECGAATKRPHNCAGSNMARTGDRPKNRLFRDVTTAALPLGAVLKRRPH